MPRLAEFEDGGVEEVGEGNRRREVFDQRQRLQFDEELVHLSQHSEIVWRFDRVQLEDASPLGEECEQG